MRTQKEPLKKNRVREPEARDLVIASTRTDYYSMYVLQ